MDFRHSNRVEDLLGRLDEFMDDRVYPAESEVAEHLERDPWSIPPVIEELKGAARAEGLWNLFMPDAGHGGPGLSNLEYAPLCGLMGRSLIGPEVFNCSFPDTGNMEVLARFGTPEQRNRWLVPLLEARIRSAFAMTEPDVASSDATSIAATVRRDSDEYVVDGRKWWISGALDPRCQLIVFLGRSSDEGPRHRRHSMVLVPADAPGVKIGRPMRVFGYEDAPSGHAEIAFEEVRIPAANLLLGEGRGFEIAQARLGPGRIHHCMRAVGMAERAVELMAERALTREIGEGSLADKGVVRAMIADSRMDVEQARLLTLKTAAMVDELGGKAARSELAQLKVVAANTGQRVVDRAIQVYGAAGLSQDTPLAHIFAGLRALRFGDGPDEVHRETVAKAELKRAEERLERKAGRSTVAVAR